MMNVNDTRIINNQTTMSCDLSTNELIYASIQCCIVFAGIFGNTVVLIIFYPCQKKKQKPYDLLIWYLSLFDFIASFIIIPEVYEYLTCYKEWVFGWFGCKMLYSFYSISINISVCILIIMTIDRYRNIVMPFKKKLNLKIIHWVVFASVVIACCIQWYQFKALYIHVEVGEKNNTQCYQNKNSSIYTIPRTITLVFRDIIFTIVFSITTISINHTLVTRKKRMSSVDARTNKKHQKALNMLVLLGISFAILVLPYDAWDCAMLISRMLPPSYHIQLNWNLEQLDAILSNLQMCSSAVNCLIYAKMHHLLKNNIHKLWNKRSEELKIPDNINYRKTSSFELQLLSKNYQMKTTQIETFV